jgi:hypothetical protein
MPEHRRRLPRVIIYRPTPQDRVSIRLVQQSIEEAKKALELPCPSIFLGERTHEPFPTENDE